MLLTRVDGMAPIEVTSGYMMASQRRASPPEPARTPASHGLPSYAVGIVNYRTYADLAHCLASVKTQTLTPTRVIVVDNDPIARELRDAQARHPEVEWQPAELANPLPFWQAARHARS